MSVRTIFIDVDLTLINADNELLPGARKGLEWLKNSKGYKLVCWSAGGEEYARRILKMHALTGYFDAILDKPDIVIDDSPDRIIGSYNIVKVWDYKFWEGLKDNIFRKNTANWTEPLDTDAVGFCVDSKEEDGPEDVGGSTVDLPDPPFVYSAEADAKFINSLR